jgi:hypothetical protein
MKIVEVTCVTNHATQMVSPSLKVGLSPPSSALTCGGGPVTSMSVCRVLPTALPNWIMSANTNELSQLATMEGYKFKESSKRPVRFWLQRSLYRRRVYCCSRLAQRQLFLAKATSIQFKSLSVVHYYGSKSVDLKKAKLYPSWQYEEDVIRLS